MLYRLRIVLAVALVSPRAGAAIINVPADQPTIQAGVFAANPGDEVVVAPGTYTEYVVIQQAITLRSNAGAAATTIAGNGTFPVVSVSGADPVIQGFTIRDGVYHDLAGLLPGAGITVCNANPTILECTFIDNFAEWSSAGGAIGGCQDANTSCTVSDCTFINNGTLGHGGAIWMMSATVSNCIFEDNQAGPSHDGGAIWLAGEGLIDNSTFTGNSAVNGGAVWTVYASVTGCTFIGNTASGNGGGVYMGQQNGRADSVTDCTFESNVAGGSGGGAWIETGGVMTGCGFSGNSAFNGGGLAMSGAEVTGCTFDANSASSTGGGLDVTGNSPVVSQCTVRGNTAVTLGGGVHIGAGVTATLTDTTFCQNMPDDLDSDGIVLASGVVIAINGADCDEAVTTFGACCLPDGACVTATESSCLSADGAYQGDGAICAEAACSGPCPGDVDHDGLVGIQDFLMLLAAWGSCP